MATPYANSVAAHAMTWPIRGIKAVTKSDSVDLPDGACRGLWVTGAGDVAVYTEEGDEVTLTLAVNTIYPFAVGRVLSTGTTATGIYALY